MKYCHSVCCSVVSLFSLVAGAADVSGVRALKEAFEAKLPTVIEAAPVIDGIFGKDEWGGCNQAYLLDDGKVLVAGHLCYSGTKASNGMNRGVYCNASFVFDPATHTATRIRIVATRKMYPEQEPKVPHLDDCVFTSGFVFNADGTCDIYTGLCDAAEGRVRVAASDVK